MFQCILQTRIATFSFFIIISYITNFFKTLNFSTLAAFFLKANAQKEATETVYGDQSVTVAILQIKRKEWKIT